MTRRPHIQTHRVSEPWTATYSDPIQLTKGDTVHLTGRTEIWYGHTWLWVRNSAGKKGWVPDSLLSKTEPVTAHHDYSAMELSCETGQVLTAEATTHGWVLCRNPAGKSGWVPERNLIPLPGGAP